MEQQSVNQRLNLIVETFENGKKAAFARKAGISPQGVQELLAGRKGDPSFKVLVGNGSMLKDEPIDDSSEVKKHDILHSLGRQYLNAGADLYRWNTIGRYIKRVYSIAHQELIASKRANATIKEEELISRKEAGIQYERLLADFKKEIMSILKISIEFSDKEEKRVHDNMLRIKNKQASIIGGGELEVDNPKEDYDDDGVLRTLIF
jgi:hypothetical protein